MITVTETKGKSSDRPSIKKQQRDLRVVGSVSAGFLGLPESTADVSSLHLSFFFHSPLTHLLHHCFQSPACAVYSWTG